MSKGIRIDFLFVPFPQEIWREGLDLTESEFKLLGYLLYHQARFGRGIIAMSDDEMLNGRRGPNGARVDSGCGIKGRNNLKTARQKLIDRDWLECEQDARGTKYKIQLSDVMEDVSKTDSGVSKIDTPVMQGGIQNGQKGYPKRTGKVSEIDTHNKEEKELYIEHKDIKPAAAASAAQPSDSRYQPCVDVLHRYHAKFAANVISFDLWFGKVGGSQLKNTLKKHEALTVEEFTRLVGNRARSPGEKHAEPVYAWVGRILDFVEGPKGAADGRANGKSGQPVSKAAAKEQRIVDNVLRYRAATAGTGSGASSGPVAVPRDGGAGVHGLDGEPEIIPPGQNPGRT